MPHAQQERGLLVQTGAALLELLAVPDAKVENFLDNLVEPHSGHFAPFQLLERTNISLSRSHFSQ